MLKCSIFGFINPLGQRDKPFVRDDEHDVRTPRPDLFDKPYATDFAGETFRKVNFTFYLISSTFSNAISKEYIRITVEMN